MRAYTATGTLLYPEVQVQHYILSTLDSIQNIAAKLCCELFVSLQHHHYAAAVELLLKLLDGHYHELLQTVLFQFSHFTISSYIVQKIGFQPNYI